MGRADGIAAAAAAALRYNADMSETLLTTPAGDRFRMPAEFEPHRGCWMLWPARPDNWREGALPAQRAFTAVATAIAQFEPVTVGASAQQYEFARAAMPPAIRVVELSSDDAWMRDVGPTCVVGPRGVVRGVDWRFNAWGGLRGGLYFPWDQDDLVARKVLEVERLDRYRAPLVCEGGALHTDGQGTLLLGFGERGTGRGQFMLPAGMFISADDRVYVADAYNRRIQVFDPRGKFLFKWGKQGAKPGEFGASSTHRLQFFAGPTFLALDSKGNLYATEARECRVQKFAPEGKPLLLWGGDAEKPGQFGGLFGGLGVRVAGFHGPMGICVDNKDRVWVCSIAGRVQQFSEKGAYLQGFGAAGTKPGQFYAPHGMAIDSRGALFVVDSFNHRIQKFAAAK